MLLAYTDGLAESRTLPLDTGIAQLAEVLAASTRTRTWTASPTRRWPTPTASTTCALVLLRSLHR